MVECSIRESVRPELIRGKAARLVLEPRFATAVEHLKIGQHLLVIYHLHHSAAWQAESMPELLTRRISNRPNPIGVTLTRVVALDGSTITVVGLDALDGSPILDIKPYLPIWDEPPVTPQESEP